MFGRFLSLILFTSTFGAAVGLGLCFPVKALAQSEEERHKSFYDQLEQAKQFNHDRELGYKEFLLQQTQWEDQRAKDKKADKSRNQKEAAPAEGSPEYKADLKDKFDAREEIEVARQALVKEKKSKESKNAAQQAQRDSWAMEEYGLPEKRPRFDIAKRTLYGGKGGSSAGGPSSPGGFGGRGAGDNGNNGNNFPPPPAFDDFNDNFPPPPIVNPEQFESPEGYPPVPIPPSIPNGGDFDNGYYPPPNIAPENMGDSF